MKTISLSEIQKVFDADAVIQAVRNAFIGHYHLRYVTPMPGQLLFEDPAGDCHIKYGYSKDGPIFVIKIATGFYGNAKLNLPVNNGMVLVSSRQTGAPLAIFQDEGWLTSWRTAAAGTLAASLAASREPKVLGIFGAGHQAQLQAIWIAKALGIEEIRIWARNLEQSRQLADKLNLAGLKSKACSTTSAVLDEARLVVTTTPSDTELFFADEVQSGTHLVALGADSPGKRELDPALFGRAKWIFTDDHEQCLDHGDFSHAVKAGYVAADIDHSLGKVLEDISSWKFDRDDISIVDLTGIPAQDVETATAFSRLLRIVDSADAIRKFPIN